MNAGAWLADVRGHANPHLTCILVGNKVDLCEPPESSPPLPTSTHPTITPTPLKQREVTTEESFRWAVEQDLLFVEASAKSGHNVDRAFEDAARDIFDKIQRGVFEDDRVGDCPLHFLPHIPAFMSHPSPSLALLTLLMRSPHPYARNDPQRQARLRQGPAARTVMMICPR